MPLIYIHLPKGTSSKRTLKISDGVHQALGSAWAIALNARFQIIQEHSALRFQMDKRFWNQKTSHKKVMIVVVTIPRSSTQKKRFYKEVIDNLKKGAQIERQDIYISLIESPEENFYV
jgi:4-oxalocrotonate tautomerase